MGAAASFGILTAIALLIGSAMVYALINEINRRVFEGQRTKALLVFAAVLVVAAAAYGWFQRPINEAWARTTGRWAYQWSSDPGRPLVIGIYPQGGFGDLHKVGLHAALEPFADEVDIEDLTATLDEMRGNAAPDLLRRLRDLVTTRNVIGVVGPPITEFTGSVIREVYLTGRQPPLFITSAAPRDAVEWRRVGIPLYRINSGADERAAEFARLARSAISSGIPLTFLVEQAENSPRPTYGQLVFDRISRQLPEWRRWVEEGRISRVNYARRRVVEDIAQRADLLFGERRIIMLLGLGTDYKLLAGAYYEAADPPRLAMLGGWMNAYETEPLFNAGDFQWGRLFEITDVDLAATEPPLAERLRQRLQRELTPATRDQAFSYDAGTILMRAYEQALLGTAERRRGMLDDNFHLQMHGAIRNLQLAGTTGPIRFNGLGQNVGLQNAQRGLTYTYFDGSSRRWRRLAGPEEIVRLSRAPQAPSVGRFPPPRPRRRGE